MIMFRFKITFQIAPKKALFVLSLNLDANTVVDVKTFKNTSRKN